MNATPGLLTSDGGSIELVDCSPTLADCIMTANMAGGSGRGGGIRPTGTSSPLVDHCIVCGNVPDQIFGSYAGSLSVAAEMCPPPRPACVGDVDGDGTVDADDLLVVLAQWGASPE